MDGQQPLELILARNLLSSISTPAFLVDAGGVLVFFNDAAGGLLGKRFEEAGKLGPEEWGTAFGPYDERGDPRVDASLRPSDAAVAEEEQRRTDDRGGDPLLDRRPRAASERPDEQHGAGDHCRVRRAATAADLRQLV